MDRVPTLTLPETNANIVPPSNFSGNESDLITPSNLDLAGSVNNLKRVMLGKSSSSISQDKPFECPSVPAKSFHSTREESSKLPKPGERISSAKRQQEKSLHRSIKVNCSVQLPGGRISSAKRQQEKSLHSPIKVNCSVQLPPKPPDIPIERPKMSDVPQASSDFAKTIAKLLHKEEKMFPPKFRFDICKETAEFNFNLLKENNFDLEELLNPEEKCITNYGSEFKSVEDLAELLHRHPRWDALKEKLEKGCEFPVEDLSEELRQLDLEAALKRGNHKSAEKHAAHLEKAMSKEIKKGWNLLLLEEDAMKIPDLELAPMGVAEQLGVSETGEFIEKLRITHDLSFPAAFSNQSVNSRVNKDELEPCMFGHALQRLIHHIVVLRKRHPDKRIWLRKEDFKSAYRRMHLRARTAKRTGVKIVIDGITYILISLRLPFGGSPCPNDFCTFSDIVVDCVNDLLECEEWDETKVFSEFIKNIPPPEPLSDDIPFAEARDLCVEMPIEDRGKCDGYIDDLMSVCVDIGNNLARLIAAPCTIIHAFSHAATVNDAFLSREDMVAIDKCVAEGAPAEVRICLGWQMNTRALLVSLPSHKCTAWSSQVNNFIIRKTAKYDEITSVLRRLENITIILRMGAHFLNNFRSMELKAQDTKHAIIIPKRVKDDAKLWLKFIKVAGDGISMNIITFRKPNVIIIGDACEHGLGAFNIRGRGWRLIIPAHLRGRAHINLLEFLTQVIQIWLDILEGRIKEGDCILAMGDNTSSMGWLRRTNFRAKDESDQDWLAKQHVARKLAEQVLSIKALIYSQWFKGEYNVGTDSLSRDCLYLTEESHECMLKRFSPTQVPEGFYIRPLPNEIVSFVYSILEGLPVKEHRLIKPKPSELLLGVAGTLSSSLSGLQSIFSSTECPDSKRISSCPPLLKQFEKLPSLDKIKTFWWKEQSTPPSHTYHRPSGQTLGKTPDWTQTVRLASSCKNNIEDTKMKTKQRTSRKLSQHQC